MKIIANDINRKDAERFDSFSSFLLKQQYLIMQLKMTLKKLSKRFASLPSILLTFIFMLKIFSF